MPKRDFFASDPARIVTLARFLKGVFVDREIVDKDGKVRVARIADEFWDQLALRLGLDFLPRLGRKKRGAPKKRQSLKAVFERRYLLQEFKRRQTPGSASTETEILEAIRREWLDPQAGKLAGRPISTLRRELELARREASPGGLMYRIARSPLTEQSFAKRLCDN